MLDSRLVIVGAVLNLIGSSSYVIATLKGQTRPNRVSWFIWAFAALLAFAAEISKGVGIQSLMTFMVGFGPLLVFIASFINKKAYWQITRLDWYCGGLALTALALWAITKEANLAIAFAILADGLAAVPTLIKSYRHPQTEHYGIYLMGAISAGLTLLTIKDWTFAHYGFPIYILLICIGLVALITIPRKSRPQQEPAL